MGELYDPRAVANFIIRSRKLMRLETTQIEVQKLLFFSYESFLIGTGRRLVKGYFEAWQYGPVHPVVYRAFRKYGGSPIQEFATALDPMTKQPIDLKEITDTAALRHINEIVSRFSGFSAGQLIDISHHPRGPWQATVDKARTSVALGMRITDNVIIECMNQRGLISNQPPKKFEANEPDDEAPFAEYRPS